MTNQSLLAVWGLTTTAGYLATHAMGVAGTEILGLSVFGSIVTVWAFLMLPPLGMTVALAGRRRADSHHWVWVGLVVAGMAANVGVAASGVGHSHDGAGHGGSSESASAHGEPGHHSGSSGAEDATAGASGGAADAEGADGHAHPDGGHGDPGGDGSETTTAGSASSNPSSSPGNGDDEAGGGLVDAAELQHAAYFHLWFLVGALGFAFSAAVAHGGTRRALYGLAALLNALMVLALVVVPSARGAAFLVAAAVQGLPMLLDLPLRARQPAAG